MHHKVSVSVKLTYPWQCEGLPSKIQSPNGYYLVQPNFFLIPHYRISAPFVTLPDKLMLYSHRSFYCHN